MCQIGMLYWLMLALIIILLQALYFLLFHLIPLKLKLAYSLGRIDTLKSSLASIITKDPLSKLARSRGLASSSLASIITKDPLRTMLDTICPHDYEYEQKDCKKCNGTGFVQ